MSKKASKQATQKVTRTAPVKRWLLLGALCLAAVGLGAYAQDGAAGGQGDGAATDDLPIAVQMYSLRTYGSAEGPVFEEQLQLAADAGYRYIETVGDYGLSGEEMNVLLDTYGLEIVSAHYGMDALRDDLEGVISFNQAVGNTNIAMPYAEADGAEGWQALGEELGEIGAQLQQEGIQLAYHNHAHEMEELDGQLALDWLLEAAEPQNLMVQLDVGWVTRGGQDPAELLGRYGDRVISIHAKDNAPEGENVEQDGWESVGYGVLAWDEVLAAASGAGTQWYIVEHDNPRDHLTSIQRSFDFLSDTLPAVLGRSDAAAALGPEARALSALQRVMELSEEAVQAAQAAAQADSVEAVKAHADEVYTAIWGTPAAMEEGSADAQVPGWAERWRVSAPELGIIGNALYARNQLRALGDRSATSEEARGAAERADVSLSNVIGWAWLDDGLLYGEKTARPRVDLTYVWDYPVEFWQSTADTGWLYEAYAQALNILKTDYQGNVEMARTHAEAMLPFLERAVQGEDANGDGTVEAVEMEGGLNTVMEQFVNAGWTGESASR